MLVNRLKAVADEYDELVENFYRNSYAAHAKECLVPSVEEAETYLYAEEGELKNEGLKN